MSNRRPKRFSAASEAARYLSSLGARKGGLASAAALTPEQLKAKARAAITARWAKRPEGELPIDQSQVMARLRGIDSVTLAIAPGSGGRRRRAAIATLESAGKLVVTAETTTDITISAATPAPVAAK